MGEQGVGFGGDGEWQGEGQQGLGKGKSYKWPCVTEILLWGKCETPEGLEQREDMLWPVQRGLFWFSKDSSLCEATAEAEISIKRLRQ